VRCRARVHLQGVSIALGRGDGAPEAEGRADLGYFRGKWNFALPIAG
jgi:hypothetical protein